MKNPLRHILLSAATLLFLSLNLALPAQESQKTQPTAPPTPEVGAASAPAQAPDVAAPPAAPAVPMAEAAPSAPPAAPAPAAAPATPEAPAPAAEATPSAEEKALRRLDAPAEQPETKPGKKAPRAKRPRVERSSGGGDEVPFGDHHVTKGSRTREAVSIMGSTRVEGEVDGDAVAVMGSTEIGPDGKVGGTAVAVLGKLESKGSIGHDAVSILGGVDLDGPVKGEVVSVMGDVRLGPKAVVERDVVIVGGALKKDPEAIIRGKQVNVPIFGGLGDISWLTTYVKRCVFFVRPLAFGEHLGWAWVVACSFLAFYVLLALMFRRGMEKCVTTFETRPGWSVLSALLTTLLTPVVILLLIATVVGLVVLPFLGLGLLFAGLFGKAVMLAWLGRRFTRFFGEGPLAHPAFAVLLGGVIVMLLYTIPVFGFLLYKLLGWLGLGVVVYAIALALKRDKPASPAAAAGLAPVGMVAGGATSAPPVIPMAAPAVRSGFAGATDGSVALAAAPAEAAGFAAAVPMVPPPVAAPAVEVSTLPRAGFWIRVLALAVDGILIGMIAGFLSGMLPRFLQFGHGPGGVLLALAVYAAILWKHKGTTIGGIVFNLKVVRLDQRAMDWTTAIVRALSCFLSLFIVGLGFIWVAFDDEKQSWHDKIAGTTVVRMPKGVSLL